MRKERTRNHRRQHGITATQSRVAIDAGKIYTYDVTVTKYAVVANGSIGSWEVGSTGTGVAE